jgi:hypothetical protein
MKVNFGMTCNRNRIYKNANRKINGYAFVVGVLKGNIL